jgi:hypothetical protein
VTLRRVVERRARAVVGAVGVLIALLYASIAQAAPIRVRIDAQLAGDLSYIEGVIRVDGADGVALVDPLADLPMPESDLVSQRTFPGLPERGVVRFEEIAPGTWWFYTLLPRRYGDLGSIPRFGLFANGGWYPQPLVGGAPPIADWGVVVRGPEGVTIVIGDEVGDGTARWRGYGERASLAAIPGGRVTDLREDGVALRLVTRGRPSPAVVDGLRAGIAESRGGAPLRGVIVEAPLRRRLVRPGNQTVYLSDRAFRVTPGLARFHRVAVAKGVLEGTLPHPDPWVRSWIAAIFADRYERGLAASGRQRLRGLAWLPTVDALLNDGTMPFYAEVLGDALPGDPLQDDLMERYAPHAAAASAVRQLYAAVGVEAADRWADAALRGAPPLIAAELAGIDPGLVIALRAPVAGQDVYVRIDASTGVAEVHRDAPPGAAPRAVVVDVDGDRTTWVTHDGPDATIVPLPPGAQRVRVDPDRLLEQHATSNDAAPRAIVPTAAAWIDEIDLSRPDLSGTAAIWVRPAGSARHVAAGSLYTDVETLVGATAGYTYRFGPLRDHLYRMWRLSVWLGPSALDPGYAATSGPVALGGGAGWSWDTRVSTSFPERGHRLETWVDGGAVPGAPDRWGRAQAAATGLAAIVPRVVVAGRVAGGVATGQVDHRLLPLGAADALRCLPPGEAIGTARAASTVELRVAVIRNGSVPALVVWGSDLQVSGGAELGVVQTPDGPARALGATAGLTLGGDIFGVEPRSVGLTAAWLVLGDGLTVAPAPTPRLSLRWSQAF